jgi:hypothetical protein
MSELPPSNAHLAFPLNPLLKLPVMRLYDLGHPADSNIRSICWNMSTKDQLLYSFLHGTAMRYAAERRNLDESIEELRQIVDGRNDVLAEAAGIIAGSWYASPATHVGYELIGAGMLIAAGDGRGLPMDYDELERWTRVGYERGTRSRRGER